MQTLVHRTATRHHQRFAPRRDWQTPRQRHPESSTAPISPLTLSAKRNKRTGSPTSTSSSATKRTAPPAPTFDGEDEKPLRQVHDADFIRAAKRLYMTATPRIYGDSAKTTASVTTWRSTRWIDVVRFGRRLYVITSPEAVKRGLLVDYKVIVLSIEETHVSRRIQNLLRTRTTSSGRRRRQDHRLLKRCRNRA